MSCWGLQLLIDAKVIWNIKAKAIYEQGWKKHGKLPLFLPGRVQQPRLRPLWEYFRSTGCNVYGLKIKYPVWSQRQQTQISWFLRASSGTESCAGDKCGSADAGEEEEEEEVAPGAGNIRLGSMSKALRQRYPLGCPTPAIKVTPINSQNGFIRISKMI